MIKEAFVKIKEDIMFLKDEINSLRSELNEFKSNTTSNTSTHIQTIPTHIQTIPTQNLTEDNTTSNTSTHIQTIPTQNNTVGGPYTSNFDISIGNDGVPTNKQTNQQIDQQTQKTPTYSQKTEFQQVNDILESLDEIKKGIRLKFKRLTNQEMLVFSHLYGLQEQNYDEITYKKISLKMNLSESSIRDYINKLIKKGIPVDKTRLNNKTILLSVSKDLLNITNLATIQSLRQI